MKKQVTSRLAALALSFSFVAGAPGLAMAQAPAVTDAQIDQYVRANLGDPAKIASAMAQYNVNLDRIQRATGYSRAQMVDYIEKSNNAALKAHLAAWNRPPSPPSPPSPPAGPAPQVTDAQIDEFIRANLNSPSKIAEAMVKYDVGLARIQRATGYTREQIADYVAKSNNAYLKKELESWNRSVPNTVVKAEYDGMPEAMKGGYERNGQPIIVIRAPGEIDKLPASMWRGMTSAAIASSKAQILRALENENGIMVLGVNGAQVRVPGKADPAREYPAITAGELASLKAQLKQAQDASTAAQSRLEQCQKQKKPSCDAERRAFDRARMPAFDLKAAVAVGELELLPASASQGARFSAVHEASYSSSSALNACMSTSEVLGSRCKAQFDLALKQSLRMESVARDMLTRCTSGGVGDCTALRAQSDAMERTTSQLKERFAAFERKQTEARAAGRRGA